MKKISTINLGYKREIEIDRERESPQKNPAYINILNNLAKQ